MSVSCKRCTRDLNTEFYNDSPNRGGGVGGDSHMKVRGMLVGKLELNPKGDQSGRGSGVI